jgi:hypothetical protein
MNTDYQIPEPVLFNPMKHHLGFIKEFICLNQDKNLTLLTSPGSLIRHIGGSVMDIYNGNLQLKDLCFEIDTFLSRSNLYNRKTFADWIGDSRDSFRVLSLSDGSEWTLKQHDNPLRYVHIFPARYSQHTFRLKSNTLKSAILYMLAVGKDLVTGDDLNEVRAYLGLSPIKDPIDSEAIMEIIEILRD